MTMNTVLSSTILFLMAGYDTTANALSFAFYSLAVNPKCQQKLREELQLLQDSDGDFGYQDLMEAKYLDACFSGLNLNNFTYFL